MAVERKLVTAEELLRMSSDGVRYELIDGELRMLSPVGGEHGRYEGTIAFRLGLFLDSNPIGQLLTGEPGVILRRDPDRVRAPDVAVILNEHIPAEGLPKGFLGFMPDLLIEVVSPNDTASEVEEKVQEWLRAGARAVWVVYGAGPRLWVHMPDGTAHAHGPDDVIEGGDALPGFRMRLADLLRPPGA